jgi:hypothetical protein
MVMAVRQYPSEYDWRYVTISNLVYPDRNPTGYLWASAGILLGGLFGLCWVALQVSVRKPGADGQSPIGISTLGLGYGCMVCTAFLPGRQLPVPKAHEIFALSAFFAVCFGLVRLTFEAAERSLLRRTRMSTIVARMYAGLLAGAALWPISLAAVAQAYISYAHPELKWVSLSWRALDVPVCLSFAFWEWVTCAVLSVYMSTLSLIMPEVRK